MAEGWVSAASISLFLSLLSTYGYLVPSVLALPGKKYIRADDDFAGPSVAEDDSSQPPRAAPLLRRSFRLEDFLWTGSGDGPEDSVPGAAAPPPHSFQVTTVFRTTTIVTTVHHTPTPPSSSHWVTSTTSCSRSCISPSSPSLEPSEEAVPPASAAPGPPEDGATPSLHRTFPPEATPTLALTPTPSLAPTPTTIPPSTPATTKTPTALPPSPDAETLPQYWLLTVLRGPEGDEPMAGVLASRLARLYKKAFMRQQERHLGIVSPTAGPQQRQQPSTAAPPRARRGDGTAEEWGVPGWRRPRALDPVLVRILRVTKREDRSREAGGEVELLYSVHVGGRPVPAKTAAEDMKLISDEEATKELGYSVVTKAEPYLKESGRTMSSNGVWKGHAWAVVVVAVASGILVLLLAALLACIAKRQRKKQRQRRLVSGAEPTDVSALAAGSERTGGGGGGASGALGAANRRQVFESGACTNLGYEGAESDPDAKLVIRPAGASKGSSWLPKHSDVFPAPSAPPHRPESAVSLDGERQPRRAGVRKAQIRKPPHADHRRHPSGDHRRMDMGGGEEGEGEEGEGEVVAEGDYRHAVPRGVEDEEEEDEEEYGGILRVSSKRRGHQPGRGERAAVRRKRRPSGRASGLQQRYPSATVRMEEPSRARDPSPNLREDIMGVSEGEQDWITSPLPIHRTLASPTSYLSMPSVRAFPKGANIPEPLALVLEGNRHPVARDSVSVRHLDVYPEASAFEPQRKGGYPASTSRHSRHGSIDGEDPGVLGPKVFEVVRRQRELRRESALVIGGSRGSLRQRPDDNLILPLGEGARLRRRFHDLLDDTLILFGKRYGEQTKTEKLGGADVLEERRPQHHHLPPPGPSRVDFRSQSAYARAEEPLLGYMERPTRPKTSMSRPLTSDIGGNAWSAGHRRSRVASAGPRGAWGPTEVADSPSSSGRVSSTLGLFTRPVSAGPFHHHHHHVMSIPPSVPHDSPPPPAPSIDTTLVMVDPQMPASDPAIPLIQAIKAELRKFHTNDTPS